LNSSIVGRLFIVWRRSDLRATVMPAGPGQQPGILFMRRETWRAPPGARYSTMKAILWDVLTPATLSLADTLRV
jgi:hypothetical protein